MIVAILTLSCVFGLAVAAGVVAFRRSQETQSFRRDLAELRRNPEPDQT